MPMFLPLQTLIFVESSSLCEAPHVSHSSDFLFIKVALSQCFCCEKYLLSNNP